VNDDTFERAKASFAEGVAHFEAGRLTEAERRFEASLSLLPDRASTLANLAAVRIRQGALESALELLERSLSLQADQADAWCQRGIALAGLGRDDDAIASFERSLAVDASLPAAWYHLGCMRNEVRQHARAFDAFERLLALDSQQGDAWFRRGQTLQWLDRHGDALLSYQRALAIDPSHAQAWINCGGIHREAGRVEAAAAAYRQALAHGADPELLRFYLASVEGQGTPAAPPRGHLQQLFDGYAERFDDHLVQVLRYRGHERLVDLLRQAAPGWRFAQAIDLGCGTGLCGVQLKPLVDHLDGVDLSAQMLVKARSLRIYERLEQADVVEHLNATVQRYDLVAAADVFTYIGDLDRVFAAVARVLKPQALFAFCVELATDHVEYELRGSLRYAHSRRYIEALATRHGYRIAQTAVEPMREDQRRPLNALYAVLSR
jgi:predicted TPR repeat methyltransferase